MLLFSADAFADAKKVSICIPHVVFLPFFFANRILQMQKLSEHTMYLCSCVCSVFFSFSFLSSLLSFFFLCSFFVFFVTLFLASHYSLLFFFSFFFTCFLCPPAKAEQTEKFNH